MRAHSEMIKFKSDNEKYIDLYNLQQREVKETIAQMSKQQRIDALKESCLHDWKLRLMVKETKRLAEMKIKQAETGIIVED